METFLGVCSVCPCYSCTALSVVFQADKKDSARYEAVVFYSLRPGMRGLLEVHGHESIARGRDEGTVV